MDCIFCKIAQGKLNANIKYEDESVLAFADVNPQAPEHLLIIPRQHIASLNDLTPAELPLIGKMVATATALAKEKEQAEAGYRLVMNCNAAGGQTVFHIHLHLLAGRTLHWPPG